MPCLLPLHWSTRKAPGLGEKHMQGHVGSHSVQSWGYGLQRG